MSLRSIGAPLLITFAVVWTAAGQTPDELLQKCDAAYAKSKYADAVKHCTKAIEARPGFDEALMARAAAYEKLGDYSAAIADYTDLIRQTNGMAMFYFYRAGIYQKRRMQNEAIADLTAAIQKEPTARYAGRSYFQRGSLYDEQGKTELAQADYASAVNLNVTAAKAKLKPPPPMSVVEPTPVAKPVPAPRPRPSPMATVARPTPSPTPVPQYRPSTPSPVPAVKSLPTVTTTTTTPPPYEPHVDNKDAEPLFKQGMALLKANKPDLAVTTFLATLGKYPPPTDEVVSLLMLVDKTHVYEQIAAGQLAGGHTDDALETYKSSLNNAFTGLSNANAALARKRPKSYGEYADLAKPMIDADVAMLSLLHPSAVKIDALGKRYISSIQAAKLNTDQLMKSLQVGILKLAAGEMSAIIFQTSADLRLSLANLCKTIIARKCGPGSAKNQVDEYAKKALADMDQAIAIAPAVKDSYALRAQIHRFMGRADLAAIDEAKAK